ncbi:hypothetical protein BCR32DRAFT_69682 [Anaeromyces robustus]|uniref:SNF2 N-terminal domain-containing protein n=1 Tax=Anaeromyces robustus TaxID=1754192 RepID=A0A1Y1WUM9_9FUNG|nr:hypothetical protein BCR32DRAFT_69682 [Anaeromyces robustus]|eukprot:ORX76844.1 hypothetical protein BCR32DRAFT_69682 [Anaeromyces robustus]
MLNAKHWENEYDFEKVLTLYEKLSELLKELLPSYCEEKIKKKISELKNKINIIIKNGGYYYDSKKSNYYLPGGFQLPENLYNRLYSYEKDGIKWIYSLFREKKCGCILADDEELNKKMQIIGVITGLYYSMKAEKFLLIVPSKKLSNWEKELKRYIALNDLDILS